MSLPVLPAQCACAHNPGSRFPGARGGWAAGPRPELAPRACRRRLQMHSAGRYNGFHCLCPNQYGERLLRGLQGRVAAVGHRPPGEGGWPRSVHIVCLQTGPPCLTSVQAIANGAGLYLSGSLTAGRGTSHAMATAALGGRRLLAAGGSASGAGGGIATEPATLSLSSAQRAGFIRAWCAMQRSLPAAH